MNSTKILSREEIAAVLADLDFRAKRSDNARKNRIIFRLSCCCGLRRMEICGLNLDDVIVHGSRPCISIRKENTKGVEGRRRARTVPLWWDEGTLRDIAAWKELLLPLTVGSFLASGTGARFIPEMVSKRWQTAIKVLGPERVRQLSIHSGRHSFCSHALAGGRSLTEVREAAGHRDISTTGIYLHMLDNDVPDIFNFDDAGE